MLKARAPHCCRQCPGRPLRSQCEHTAVGRVYLSEQRAEENVERPAQLLDPVIPETPAISEGGTPFVRGVSSPIRPQDSSPFVCILVFFSLKI